MRVPSPPRYLIAAVLVAAALLGACQRHTPLESDGLAFPLPDRPVAPIVSPAYSDEETRDRDREAERVFDRLGIRSGERVADIGAGEGYYTVRLARRLGPGAIVYAEDVDPTFLKRLKVRLMREGLGSVRTVLGAPQDPKLPPDSIDLALLSHVYHEIENPFAFMYRLSRSLAPEGRVAIVEADRLTQNHGTPPVLLTCEMAAVGYRQVDFLRLTPTENYLAVFAAPSQLPPVESIRPCGQQS
jgi:ubiquinone/menaquinone biosynthesis C-methylase UbiE